VEAVALAAAAAASAAAMAQRRPMSFCDIAMRSMDLMDQYNSKENLVGRAVAFVSTFQSGRFRRQPPTLILIDFDADMKE
jgi:hypothetical protein